MVRAVVEEEVEEEGAIAVAQRDLVEGEAVGRGVPHVLLSGVSAHITG